MPPRKRGRQEMEAGQPPSEEEPSILNRLRNMWEFANLMQYLFFFGKAVKVDDALSIEDLEAECLKPVHSEKLSEIGLAFLKFVSSQRGLTPDTFDEQLRKQYRSKLPERNPFGDSEEPKKFADLGVFTKIRVLWQLSQWTMIHSDRIRERMAEQKDDQTYWRIEPAGWDSEERTYFLLDDNRLYRQTDPPPPPPPAPKPKKNSKKAKALARANKRRKLEENVENGNESDTPEGATNETPEDGDDGLGGMKWECVAITVAQYKEFMESIRKSRDENEKALYQQCLQDILPVIEKAEEEQQRKLAKKQRELQALEKLATAKRSSRIAGKLEKQKEAEEAAKAERKRKADLVMAKKEQERLKKLEQDRESRIMTREQRLKEREMRRILHEQELASLSEDTKRLEQGEGRLSERHLKVEMEKRKKALEELENETDWDFDCSGCGVHGQNLDDGTGIISCERCNVWQHLACLGFTKQNAEREDFHFICGLCKRREEDKQKSAKNPIKIDLRKLGSSMSPPAEKTSKTGSSISPPTDKASKINGEAPKQRKRRISDEASGSPSKKKAKLESGATSLTPVEPGFNTISSSTAVVGNESVPSGVNQTSMASENQSTLIQKSSLSAQMGASESSGWQPGAPSSQAVQPSTNGINISKPGPECNGSMDVVGTKEIQPLTSPHINNGSTSNFPNSQRPYTPTTSINTNTQIQQQPPSPNQGHHNKDLPRPGFPGPSVLATPPSAIFHPPPSSLGYSPTKQPSPRSAKLLQSPNGALIPGTSILPSSSSSSAAAAVTGISSTKTHTPPSSGGDSAVLTAGTLGGAGTSIIPPGPALSPKQPKLDLTPPRKKLTAAAPGPAPEQVQVQMNGLHHHHHHQHHHHHRHHAA
ncbi:MAG: hypothetical protein M1816_008153 [Peltula sp. TS41687]|nr:MAG: hypothetical protein M1816_008153 [Peltula sp. TS41687]